MKFGKQLERYKVQRWGEFYVDYNALKHSLEHGYCTDSEQSGAGRDKWFLQVEESIDRVNEFFQSIADEIESRVGVAAQEFHEADGTVVEEHLRPHLESLVQELQATLVDLSHFAAANYTALYKIFKKHDKLTGHQLLPVVMREITEEPFHDPGKQRLEKMRLRLHALASRLGMDSELSLVPVNDYYLTGGGVWPLVRLSFSLGVICMALVVLAVLSGMEPQNADYSIEALAATIPVFRLVFMMNIVVWLAGGCAFVLERYKINYLFLLDISPELNATALSLINFASVHTVIWIVIFFGFLADLKFGAVLLTSHPMLVESHWNVAHIYTGMLLVLQLLVGSLWLSPVNLSNLFSLFFRGLWAPVTMVSFAENILSDFLTSAGRPLKDLAYTGCYLRNWRALEAEEVHANCGSTNATLQLVLILPLLVRMSQCLRRIRDTGSVTLHLLNCLKYSVAVIVSLLAALQPSTLGLSPRQMQAVRIGGYVTATIYATSWDLAVDFGLFKLNRRCFFPGMVYIAIAALDVALRSTWLLTYLPDCRAFVSASTFNSECFSFAIGVLELFRRAIWAIIRLEHEHLSNAGRFRSVCWVPPLEHRQLKDTRAGPPAQRRLRRWFCSEQPTGLSLSCKPARVVGVGALQSIRAHATDSNGDSPAGAGMEVIQASRPLTRRRTKKLSIILADSMRGQSFEREHSQAALCRVRSELQDYNGLLPVARKGKTLAGRSPVNFRRGTM